MSEQRLGVLIRQLQGKLGGRSQRGGTQTLTWTTSKTSAVVTITHGLGTTPTDVQVTLTGPPSGTTVASGFAVNFTATTFDLFATADTSNSASTTASWTAFG